MPGIVMGGLSGRLFGELLREANLYPYPNPNPNPSLSPNPNPNQVTHAYDRVASLPALAIDPMITSGR